MAHFTPGQVLTGAEMNEALLVVEKDGGVTGSAPAIPGSYEMIAGQQTVAFTAGAGTITIAGGGFANGLLCAIIVDANAAATDDSVVTYTQSGSSKTAIAVKCNRAGSAFGSSATISYIAIGW